MSQRSTPCWNSKAFTIMEVLVVVMVIGILMVIGVARYLRSSESGGANQAISELNMVSAGNRNYSLDHRRVYASGVIDNSCNTASCTGTGAPCDIVACGYITRQDWTKTDYNFYVLDPNNPPSACNLSGYSGSNFVACAARRVCGGGVTTNCVSSTSAYASWGYLVDSSGVVQPVGGAPAPAY